MAKITYNPSTTTPTSTIKEGGAVNVRQIPQAGTTIITDKKKILKQ